MCLVYFTKDVKDWFGYDKLNVFFRQVSHALVFNGRTALTTWNILHTLNRRIYLTFVSGIFIYE